MGWTYRFHDLGSGILAARAARRGRLAVSRTLFGSDTPLLYRDALDHELDHGTDAPEALYLVVAGVLPDADGARSADGGWSLRTPSGVVSLDAAHQLTVAGPSGALLWQGALPPSGEPDLAFFQQIETLRAGRAG